MDRKSRLGGSRASKLLGHDVSASESFTASRSKVAVNPTQTAEESEDDKYDSEVAELTGARTRRGGRAKSDQFLGLESPDSKAK